MRIRMLRDLPVITLSPSGPATDHGVIRSGDVFDATKARNGCAEIMFGGARVKLGKSVYEEVNP